MVSVGLTRTLFSAVLVLVNKSDREGAVSACELGEAFGLNNITSKDCAIFDVSAVARQVSTSLSVGRLGN